MNYSFRCCRNGLETVVTEQHALPLVSVQVWVKTGSMYEGVHAGAGVSHLLEHMVFKGAGEYTGPELNERVAALGGEWNAYTTYDRTVFHIDGPAEHWRDFLHLLVQLVLHPTFPEDEFEREREVIRREMAMYNDDQFDVAYQALSQTLYHCYPRRYPVIGYRERFDAVTYSDMVRYHRDNYVPSNIFVCIGGDVEPESVFAAVAEETADVPVGMPALRAPLPNEPRQWGPRLFRREFAQPTSTLMLAWRIPPADHPDRAPLALLPYLLGVGRCALLYSRFHDTLSMAHSVYAYVIDGGDQEGAIVIEADTDRDTRDELRDAMLNYIAELTEEDLAEGVERARKQIVTRRIRRLATVKGQTDDLAFMWHRGRNPKLAEESDAALTRVTTADLLRVLRAYLLPERLCEVSVDPLGSNPAVATEAQAAELNRPTVHTLPNGLRLVTLVDRRLPLMNAALTVEAGCRTESAADAGISTLLAECMLKGTTTRNEAQVAAAAENLGGSIQSACGNNTLRISVQGLKEDTGTLLELLADVALHPTLPAKAVETEKESMLADIAENKEEPLACGMRRIRRLMFGPVSYGNHPDGTEESVRSLTPEALAAHHARLFCGGNAVLAVVGDIDPEAVQQQVSELFAAMPTGKLSGRVNTPPQQSATESLSLDKEQSVILMALPDMKLGSEEEPMQDIFRAWCNDMAGPLYKEIREKQGLVYYAAASGINGTDTGYRLFYLGCSPEQQDAALAALQRTLEQIYRDGMPAEALESMRSGLLATHLTTLQSAASICSDLALDEILGTGAEHTFHFPEQLRAVTLPQMNAYIRRLLSPDAVRTILTVEGKKSE